MLTLDYIKKNTHIHSDLFKTIFGALIPQKIPENSTGFLFRLSTFHPLELSGPFFGMASDCWLRRNCWAQRVFVGITSCFPGINGWPDDVAVVGWQLKGIGDLSSQLICLSLSINSITMYHLSEDWFALLPFDSHLSCGIPPLYFTLPSHLRRAGFPNWANQRNS